MYLTASTGDIACGELVGLIALFGGLIAVSGGLLTVCGGSVPVSNACASSLMSSLNSLPATNDSWSSVFSSTACSAGLGWVRKTASKTAFFASISQILALQDKMSDFKSVKEARIASNLSCFSEDFLLLEGEASLRESLECDRL